MCGIVGVITNSSNGFTYNELELLGQNLFINQLRGTDSTGLFSVSSTSDVDLIKSVGPPNVLYKKPEWEDFQKIIFGKSKIVIGHGRKATLGDVTEANAHPFQVSLQESPEDSITVVHNGTLPKSQSLPDFEKFAVDSQWLAHCLATHGHEKTLSSVDGALALVWWNSQEKKIYFFRNNERPLHYAVIGTKNNPTFLLNSESSALNWLIAKNNLKSVFKDDVYYFVPNTLYSLDFDDLFGEWKTQKIERKIQTVNKWAYQKSLDCELYNTYEYAGLPKYEKYTPSTPSPSANHQFGRTLETDAKKLIEGVYTKVEFQDYNKRITHYTDQTSLTEYGHPPYEAFLQLMELNLEKDETAERLGKTSVKLHFKSPVGTEYTSYRYFDAPKTETPANSPVLLSVNRRSPKSHEEETKEEVAIDETEGSFINPSKQRKFRPNRSYSFHTKTPNGKSIRHSAKILKGVSFLNYKNDIDGEFKLLEKVRVEVFESEVLTSLQGAKFWKILATRIKENAQMDNFIHFYWFSQNEAEVKRIIKHGIYEGTIGMLRLADKESYNKHGVYVESLLTNISSEKV